MHSLVHSVKKRILIASNIEGLEQSIKSAMENNISDSFEIVNADINDTSTLAASTESAHIIVADPDVLARIEPSCKKLQWVQVNVQCWL